MVLVLLQPTHSTPFFPLLLHACLLLPRHTLLLLLLLLLLLCAL
jgi:hypothetical protein